MIRDSLGAVALTGAADYTNYEGYAVSASAGTATVLASAATLPFGVITEPGTVAEGISVMPCIGAPSAVDVKIDATPGTIVEGTLLQVTATGTFTADAGTGSRVLCAQAMEAGGAGALIRARLFKPVALS